MFIYIVISIPLLPFHFIPFPFLLSSFSFFPAFFPPFSIPFYFPLFSLPRVFSSFSPPLFPSYLFSFSLLFFPSFPLAPPLFFLFPSFLFPFPFLQFTHSFLDFFLYPLVPFPFFFLPIPFLVNIILKNLVKNFNLAYFCFTISGYNYHVD